MSRLQNFLASSIPIKLIMHVSVLFFITFHGKTNKLHQ